MSIHIVHKERFDGVMYIVGFGDESYTIQKYRTPSIRFEINGKNCKQFNNLELWSALTEAIMNYEQISTNNR